MTAASAQQIEADESAITLRGTNQGLEVHIERFGSADSLAAQLRQHFGKAPSFFRGEDVVLRFAGVPVLGSFGPLEAVTRDFGLRIVAIRSDVETSLTEDPAKLAADEEKAVREQEHQAQVRQHVARVASAAAVAAAHAVAIGSGPIPSEGVPELMGTKMVSGPVRSGCVLDACGDVTVVGDVNPGAEVRAAGSIVVLGSLRGVAHAAEDGFIWALNLLPQQLRIGSLVARAGDADTPATVSEIAFAKDGQIIVEAYSGRLPGGMSRRKF